MPILNYEWIKKKEEIDEEARKRKKRNIAALNKKVIKWFYLYVKGMGKFLTKKKEKFQFTSIH
jgi:hypothetical protein